MILSEETKQKISDVIDGELKDFYGKLNDDPKKRVELGQFYTPGKVCIQMIERFGCDSLAGKDILDPACGSGNLLIACLIAGADSDRLFGNEYDVDAVELCRDRLNRACDILGKPHIRDWQIHQGNALQRRCLAEFGPEYDAGYDSRYIDDLEYAQSYEHDGSGIIKHYEALSWRNENEEAERRNPTKKIAKQASGKPKQAEASNSKLQSLF